MKKSIGRLVSILHRQSQIYYNYTFKDLNITSAEFSFLLYLYRHDGATQDELSKYLYIDKSATARALKSLENKKYIVRIKDTSDKRCNKVFLSDSAKKIKDEMIKKIIYWSDFLTEEIDDETRDIVISALEKMTKKVGCTKLSEEMEN